MEIYKSRTILHDTVTRVLGQGKANLPQASHWHFDDET